MRRKSKKRKILLFCIIGILLIIILNFLIPILINEAYIANSGYLTLWGASDVLVFYGTILSFLGTVILGTLTYFLNIKANDLNEKANNINRRANDINKRLILLEEEKFKLELQPYVLITNWKLYKDDIFNIISFPEKLYIHIEKAESSNTKTAIMCLSLFFTNTSNSYTVLNYWTAQVCNLNDESTIDNWANGTSNQHNNKLYLQPGVTGEIAFYCTKEKMESFRSKKIKLEMILENRFSEKFKEEIDIVVAQLAELGSDMWHLYLSPQNYRINKI